MLRVTRTKNARRPTESTWAAVITAEPTITVDTGGQPLLGLLRRLGRVAVGVDADPVACHARHDGHRSCRAHPARGDGGTLVLRRMCSARRVG